jgi:hypothetical protein
MVIVVAIEIATTEIDATKLFARLLNNIVSVSCICCCKEIEKKFRTMVRMKKNQNFWSDNRLLGLGLKKNLPLNMEFRHDLHLD